MKYLIDEENFDSIFKYTNAVLLKMGIKEQIEFEKSTSPDITIDDPIIYKQENDDSHITYKSYMMLHLRSDKTQDIKGACYAIEIAEDLERKGFDIIEKAIYQGIYSVYED